jgi:hypothetical protein
LLGWPKGPQLTITYYLVQLKQAVQEVWEEAPDYMLSKLMCSMEKRLKRVVENRGSYIGM